ncbi:MAG: 2-succinyl-5-enolpyruvyl-6-hydroxy-3-cyclohexene-1-carboxylic-acid synthase [Actinomycetota bacterium]
MTGPDDAYRICRSFAGALASAGVQVVSIGSGSRSTGLTLAFIDDGRFRPFAHTDERSAAFFALGAARVTGRPAAVLTTSGTAAANLLPACVEARAAGVPLILLTADRPRGMDAGAPQTIDQTGLFPPARWAAELDTGGPSIDRQLQRAAALGAEAVSRATVPPGPVHLNVRFGEPLVPSREVRTADVPFVAKPEPQAPDSGPNDMLETVAARIAATPRGIIHAGHLEGENLDLPEAVSTLAQASGYPVVAEATSRLRGRIDDAVVVDTAEGLVRDQGFASANRPEFVLRLGRAPLTRAMSEWLAPVPKTVMTPVPPWPEPARPEEVIVADPARACEMLAGAAGSRGPGEWTDVWRDANDKARDALSRWLVGSDAVFEGTAVNALVRSIPQDCPVYAATSLPIRAMEAFALAGRPLDVYANRGASGIDGTLSGALGAAAALERPVVCVAGDLAFLHDIGGLTAAARHRLPLIAIVLDNGGGGIFDFLPQAELLESGTFNEFFVQQHRLDLLHAARLFGAGFAAVRDADTLDRVLGWALTDGGPWVIRVPIDRQDSLDSHAEAWETVRQALRSAPSRLPGA